MNRISRRELIRKAWHISPGILGAPIIVFTPRWVTLLVVWGLAFLYTLQHLKLRRSWRFTVPVADLSYRQMAREDEADNYLGSFLFWVTMAMICSIFPKIAALSALWVSTFGDCFNAIIGQAVGGPKIPWNRRKTIIGSATMFGVSLVMLVFAHRVLGMQYSLPFLGLVAMIAVFLESLPIPSAYDEFTVPFATALLIWLAYGGELLGVTW
ncbi:phosphatidate cytidylyltransferase [Thermococcus sp. GR7]|uniref:diacylglycerol/polyprenol kinase family protein n=1 Tax=unclassified Thermococcus TaxID=2627626 RepID=UPI001430F947|nr:MULTISPECIES: phosphatidate cytidylyltransferase [unclassified Thermococcus]NJE46931.1 phosphatidate cytidylyltransferase [Thermococcus sp. GR7]NJE78428.1 phosphatidate cytidylyltransferase [Thermococcus sp. GR4]NJF23275.1 phosphatidate cytidylyltransferase [Thermococcus sp. GR5]